MQSSRSLHRLTLSLLLLLPGAAGAGTMEAVVAETLANNPDLHAAQLGIVMNEAQLGKALAALESAVGVDLSDIRSEIGRSQNQASHGK